MSRLITLLFVAAILVATTACNKYEDTLAKVIVVEQSDGTTPVVGATVRLYTDLSGTDFEREGIEKESTTNSSGEATFNYNDLFERGQAGLFVLDVEVTKDTYTANGIIKVVEEETSESIVEIDIP